MRYLADPMESTHLDRIRDVAAARCVSADPAHDFLHVQRVTNNARTIALAEGAELHVVLAAALLHELFNYPKNHPESSRSGDVCADYAERVLRDERYPAEFIAPVCDAIRVHSFSRGITPDALDARVLQDADRLDAIGAIGIARCFSTCASMGRPFYNPDDPFCHERAPDDQRWGVDHFYRKLLRIADGLHTAKAREIAAARMRTMQSYLADLEREIVSASDSR